jgi:hypothetical protein
MGLQLLTRNEVSYQRPEKELPRYSLARTITRFSKIIALAIGLTVVGVSSNALAVEVTPDFIEYYQGGILFGSPTVTVSNYMLIQVSGVNYIAPQTATAPCAANVKSSETIKNWLSLSQSALLSGKKIVLNFATCNGVNFISTIQLKR